LVVFVLNDYKQTSDTLHGALKIKIDNMGLYKNVVLYE